MTYRYRKILYMFHRHPTKGIMASGIPCHVEDPESDITHGDVVHPCVRYIEEGFEGHKWWMVYTPYYAGNEKIENPRLCYADTDKEPPTEWKYYCTIKDCPETGYNSDPTLLFTDGRLYVFWREYDTPQTKELGCDAATFGCYVQNKAIYYLSQPLLKNNVSEVQGSFDREICPTIIARNGRFIGYTLHHSFIPKFIYRIPSKLGSFIYRHHLFFILDALIGYKDTKNLGVGIWIGASPEHPFNYKKTTKMDGVSRLYQPWHMDLFEDAANKKDILYAVIQSSIEFADICLAWCKDGETFNLYSKPLISSYTIGMAGLYKPSAVLIGNKFYIFYTARDNQDHHLNKLFVTSEDWDALLYKLES